MEDRQHEQMKIVGIKERADNGRKLYPYQEEYIKRIFERLMENATCVSCSGFGEAIIKHME